MGRYITMPAPPRPIKKHQEFYSSGIFTPSDALLDAGGVVTVTCYGGGGKGIYKGQEPNQVYHGAGSGAVVTRIVTITGPVNVIIGSAGTGPGHDGGQTKFGDLVIAAGGKGGNNAGQASGEGGFPGIPGTTFKTYESPAVNNNTGYRPPDIPHIVGLDGHDGGGRVGLPGLCIVLWEEWT